jgi:hypothetical protein
MHTRNQAGPWFTQLQILDQPVLELNPLNFHLLLFFFFSPHGEPVLITETAKAKRNEIREFYSCGGGALAQLQYRFMRD